MSVITLLTDFGTHDSYAGIMKGVILSTSPSSTIVDITHHIDPQDITQAAFILQSAFRYFPGGTVHTIIVDPGVGSGRTIIAAQINEHLFLAPDNGVLSLVMDEERVEAIIRVNNSEYFLKPVSRTFHGRDIFAPIAGHLANGIALERLGPLVEKKTICRLEIDQPSISDTGELSGTIIRIDHFGNLITNIDYHLLKEIIKAGSPKTLDFRIGKKNVKGLSQTYNDKLPATPLALIGSTGHLEISVNCGNASQYFNAKKGDLITVIPG